MPLGNFHVFFAWKFNADTFLSTRYTAHYPQAKFRLYVTFGQSPLKPKAC